MRAECLDFVGSARDGRQGPAGHHRMRGADLHLIFPASSFAVRRALATAMATFRRMGIGADVAGLTELVLAEVLNNIVEHAYADRGHGIIEIAVRQSQGMLRFRILDDGIPMPNAMLPTAKRHDVTVEHCDLPEGGFGWALIHDLTCDLCYRRDGVRNELSFAMTTVGQG